MGDICLPGLARTVAPGAEPLTLAEAKLYLRVDGSTEDTLITSLIASVRQAAEEYLRRSLITQSWKLSFNDGAPGEVALPRGPVQSITSVVLKDRDGDSETYSAGNYYLNARKDALVFDAEPYAHLVEITYQAGYGAAAANVPDMLKAGMLAHLASLYDGRGGIELPAKTEALYAPFRVLGI
ncbi:MAG: phage head-tail connector protein [Alphaproteobacteria bacterium]|nr:phage head-tail connector protein [Alphaproteobacteria bacterium]